MNDRFKFRVWNDMQKCYSQDDHYIDEDGQLNTNGKYIVEQCTGLKDKNGKLIYENDIVREISKKEPEWEEYVTTVEWKGCGFNLYRDEDYDFEVIGNIHENADLLENEK